MLAHSPIPQHPNRDIRSPCHPLMRLTPCQFRGSSIPSRLREPEFSDPNTCPLVARCSHRVTVIVGTEAAFLPNAGDHVCLARCEVWRVARGRSLSLLVHGRGSTPRFGRGSPKLERTSPALLLEQRERPPGASAAGRKPRSEPGTQVQPRLVPRGSSGPHPRGARKILGTRFPIDIIRP
jgi:hypothetical protein